MHAYQICLLSLVRKLGFLIAQEMLELNRSPLQCLPLCTAGSDPLLQLKVIDWELGWEQESGCCTAHTANENMHFRTCFCRWPIAMDGLEQRPPKFTQQMTFCCKNVAEPITHCTAQPMDAGLLPSHWQGLCDCRTLLQLCKLHSCRGSPVRVCFSAQ